MSDCDSTNTIIEDGQTVTYRCALKVGHEGPHAGAGDWLWHRLPVTTPAHVAERAPVTEDARVQSDKGSYPQSPSVTE
jgi:hypothetical protein